MVLSTYSLIDNVMCTVRSCRMIILVFWPDILGKSFLIKHAAVDLIENNKLIIFILPTKALLEEYLIDLKSILNEKA